MHITLFTGKTVKSGKDPWVDSACANCSGFLVLGAVPASVSTFVLEPGIVPLRHFASWALQHLLGSAAHSSPTTRCKKLDAQHKFFQHTAPTDKMNPFEKTTVPKGPFFFPTPFSRRSTKHYVRL